MIVPDEYERLENAPDPFGDVFRAPWPVMIDALSIPDRRQVHQIGAHTSRMWRHWRPTP